MDVFNVLGWSDTEEGSVCLEATQPKVKPVDVAAVKALKRYSFTLKHTHHSLISGNNVCWMKLYLVSKGAK